jgi:hypothetical protein
MQEKVAATKIVIVNGPQGNETIPKSAVARDHVSEREIMCQ